MECYGKRGMAYTQRRYTDGWRERMEETQMVRRYHHIH